MRAHLIALALAVALPSGARAESDDAKQAAALATFERGEAQFALGAFDAAARLFEDAWRTWRDPAYLFNTGLAFEKAQRWPLAVEWYGRFLEIYPDVPNVSEVRRRHLAAQKSRDAARVEVVVTTEPAGARAEIVNDPSVAACTTPCTLRVDAGPVTLRVVLGQRTNEATKSLGPSERWEVALPLASGSDRNADPRAPPPPDRTGAIVSWSIGGAALVGGVVFAVMAADTYDTGHALARQDGGALARDDYDRLAGLRSDLTTQSTIADIGFGVALAGAALGTILWLVSEPDPAPTRATTTSPVTWRF